MVLAVQAVGVVESHVDEDDDWVDVDGVQVDELQELDDVVLDQAVGVVVRVHVESVAHVEIVGHVDVAVHEPSVDQVCSAGNGWPSPVTSSCGPGC